jgi:hypothetical protein
MPATIKYIGKRIEDVTKPCEEDCVPIGFTTEQIRLFKPILAFLNDKDRDILFLIFVSGKKQKDVQKILGRSQSSLCYDIKRIRKRMRFISYIYSVLDIYMNFINTHRDVFSTEEMAILTSMFYTTSFTLTSRILGLAQVRVRYTFNKCIKRMAEMEMWEPYEIFVIVRANLNIIRRVHGRGKKMVLPMPL